MVGLRLITGDRRSLGKGGLRVLSVYLYSGDGLSARNRYFLEVLGAIIEILKGPWVLGGDSNFTPSMRHSLV